MRLFSPSTVKHLISRLDFSASQHFSMSFNGIRVNVFFILMSFTLAGCLPGGEDSASQNSINSPMQSDITLSSDSVFLSSLQDPFEVTATLIGSNGVAFAEQPAFSWTSDNKEIVIVNQAGIITALSMGEANVNVTADGVTKVIPVVVNTSISTLVGKVRYEDKEYSASGFTGRANFYKAVRFAKVDLVGENGIEQSTYTDAEGNFSFSGILSSQQSISVSAVTNETLGLDLRVEDRSTALYAVSKAVDLSNLAAFTMDISKTSTAAGAFNIMDVFTNAAHFTLANTDATLVKLAAFWQPNNPDGTYFCTGFDSLYCRQGEGVYIYNSVNGDTDEFDDDVLYHEFGHYFANAFSEDDSLGGCHLLSSSDLDLRLAWSEGFGDFFPSAVKSWLNNPERDHLLSSADYLDLTAYVDTYASSAQIYIDMATISQSRYSSAANEMAVAKILWVLAERFGMPAIVKVLNGYLPNLSGNNQVNLESFWDGWLATHNPSANELSTLEGIFAERLVFYKEDDYESDGIANNSRKAILGQSETHYLYSKTDAVDLDFIAFDVQANQQYTVQTSGLTSGADTYIQVYNSTLTALVDGSNDDLDSNAYYAYDSVCGTSRVKNNSSALASKVMFTAATSGTYYAEIRTTTDVEPYLSAGRYGTYDLKISQN